ncbi:MAG: YIP1 family protein [Candidatus Diapherotrites archaeon]|nr:YIP1 family protein [Candidatus Diapherotrites archaeon]
MLNVLTNPIEALMEAKKEASLGKAFVELIIAAVLFAVAAYLGLGQLFSGLANVPGIGSLVSGGALFLAAGVFFAVIVFGVIAGFIATQIFKILGGTGGFSAGLTPLAYSWFLTSVGVVLAILLNFIPIIGALLATLVLLYFFAVGTAVSFRGFKELFDIDYVTVLVGVTLFWGAFGLALNMIATLAIAQTLVGLLTTMLTALSSLSGLVGSGLLG